MQENDIEIAKTTSVVKVIHENYNTMLERTITVCVNTKPRLWPNWFYKWAIKKLVKIKIFDKR